MARAQANNEGRSVLVSTTDLRKTRQSLQMSQRDLVESLVYTFSYIGESAVKIAREGGTYNDITGNLRSSVGYTILVDGSPVTALSGQRQQFKGEKGDGAQGVTEAQKLMDELTGKFPKGVVLIITAGMRYAEFVSRKRVVLSQAWDIAKQLVDQLLAPYLEDRSNA